MLLLEAAGLQRTFQVRGDLPDHSPLPPVTGQHPVLFHAWLLVASGCLRMLFCTDCQVHCTPGALCSSEALGRMYWGGGGGEGAGAS